MNLKGNNSSDAPPMFASLQDAAAIAIGGNTIFCKTGTENPISDAFQDPLCKLNLKETSDFVKSFPMKISGGESEVFHDVSARRREGVSSTTKRNVEAPLTPGRPIFSFSVGTHSKKTFPSKWDDAEKWLVSGSSFHESPAHHHGSKLSEYTKTSKQCHVFKPQQPELIADKSEVTSEKVSKAVSGFQGLLPLYHRCSAGAFCEGPTSVEVLLKDKFTSVAEANYPTFKCSEPAKEGFLFANATEKYMKDAANEINHRDIGTEMTPLGSSTTSRCHTPFKNTSPVRHNTPANRSGPLAIPNSSNIAQLQECHLAKLQFGTEFDSLTSNWSSREEEEKDISRSLRHFEINNECRRSVSESRTCAWEEEEEEKIRCCLRYKREEAKIQAWVNLQNAKAEAQSRKLEVKIQKMRLNLEEKLMKRMAIVHRKAEEWRTAARL